MLLTYWGKGNPFQRVSLPPDPHPFLNFLIAMFVSFFNVICGAWSYGIVEYVYIVHNKPLSPKEEQRSYSVLLMDNFTNKLA